MNRLSSRRGMTMVDVVVILTLLLVSVLTLLPLFNVTGARHTALDAGAALAAQGQEAAADIQARLTRSRRVFVDGPAAAAVLARILPALSSAPLAGTRLPRADDAADASSGTFVPANAGNSLLLAVAGPEASLPGLIDGRGRSADLKLETTVLTYDYLSPDGEETIGGRPVRNLWQWKSAPVADYAALAALPDLTLRNAAIAALVARGELYALDRSSTTAAFYSLSADLPWISPLSSSETLKGAAVKRMDFSGRKDLGYFITSVSPNTGGDFVHRNAVPLHAVADGDFPSGFEVLTAGPPENRRVMVRLVTAAQGSFRGFFSSEHAAAALVKER